MVVKKNVNDLRAYYESHWGHVDDISHVFGWASHEKFYGAMAGWHAFVDSIFPDYFPFNMVQGFLQTVIDNVYSSQAQLHYDKGVDMGRQLVGKAEEIVNWAKNQITNEVNAAKKYIQDNFITPVQNTIDQNIKPALKDAQSKIDTIQSKINEFANNISAMGNQVNGFQGTLDNFNNKIQSFNTTINDLTDRANGFDAYLQDLTSRANAFQSRLDGFNATVNDLTSKVTGFDTKLRNFNTALNDLTNKAQSLDTALKDAQNKLSQYKALIDKLDQRISALEGKQPTPEAPKFVLPSFLDQKVI